MDKKPNVATQFRTTQKVLDDLDMYAEKMGLSRNKLMNNLIELDLGDLALLNSLGLLTFGAGLRNLLSRAEQEQDEIKGHSKPV